MTVGFLVFGGLTEFWTDFLCTFSSLFSPPFWGCFTGVSVLIGRFSVPYFMTDFRGVFFLSGFEGSVI